jgi:hypothetical protein
VYGVKSTRSRLDVDSCRESSVLARRKREARQLQYCCDFYGELSTSFRFFDTGRTPKGGHTPTTLVLVVEFDRATCIRLSDWRAAYTSKENELPTPETARSGK